MDDQPQYCQAPDRHDLPPTEPVMTRYYTLFALICGILFSVVILLVRAQPFDDHNIRELLPESCSAPCFLGIYPGITTDEETLQLLKTSPWVDAETVRLMRQPPSSSKFDDLSRIHWMWSTARPNWVMTGKHPPDGTIMIRNHIVERIAFATRISAAAIYRRLGSPSILVFAPIRDFRPWSIEWVYRYDRAQLVLHMEVQACPYLADLWQPHLYVQMVAQPPAPVTISTGNTPAVDLRTVLNARKRLMCRIT